MKILQLCKKVPCPINDGERVAIYHLSKGLTEVGCSVTLLAITTPKHPYKDTSDASSLVHYDRVITHYVDTRIKPIPLLVNLVRETSYNIERFYDQEFAKVLIRVLGESDFDFIQLETLYMTPYIETIRAHSDAKICLRSHNLEYEIWKDLALETVNPAKSWYYNLCAARLLQEEIGGFSAYDLLLSIADTDLAKYGELGYNGDSISTPVGLDMKNYSFRAVSALNQNFKFGFIGSLDWRPNLEGLRWFFDEIWYKVTMTYPDVEFHLAGRNGSADLVPAHCSGITFHGEVDDAQAFMQELDLLVVPLFSGSGIRVKILESMAVGTPIASTPKGFEGIPVNHETDAFVFESDADLLLLIQDVIHKRYNLEQVALKARLLVENNFEYKSIARRVVEAMQSITVNKKSR